MGNERRRVSEVEGFIDMLLAACEDKHMNNTLEKLLSQPDKKRKEIVLMLVEDLTNKGAPTPLIEAISCLRDDKIAEKAYEAIYLCSR